MEMKPAGRVWEYSGIRWKILTELVNNYKKKKKKKRKIHAFNQRESVGWTECGVEPIEKEELNLKSILENHV